MAKYHPDWRDISSTIKDRDGRKCRLCGATARLNTHHIDGKTSNNDPGNLIALCHDCHMGLVHGNKRRGTLGKHRAFLRLLAAKQASRNRIIRNNRRRNRR